MLYKSIIVVVKTLLQQFNYYCCVFDSGVGLRSCFLHVSYNGYWAPDKKVMNGLHLRQVLDKMLKGEATKNARVQVCLPNGKYYDITSLQLLENKILGARETHRLVLTVQAETWNMGQVLKKID